MTVYNSTQTDFYIDEDGVSAFTDDNGEAVIVADAVTTEPRVFVVHFV